MNNIMLDLETMGRGPNAAITAVGAVYFDPETGKLGETFYRTVDLESSVKAGGVVDAATVLWWIRQSTAAQAMYATAGEHISTVLIQFAEFCERGDDASPNVWGNGASFDNVILRSAYDRAGIACPWEFWSDRCYRTMRAMLPQVDAERSGTYHNALDDATTQARVLMAAMKKGKLDGCAR
jgi:hypothetical protein